MSLRWSHLSNARETAPGGAYGSARAALGSTKRSTRLAPSGAAQRVRGSWVGIGCEFRL
jgi:hypothetical protein